MKKRLGIITLSVDVGQTYRDQLSKVLDSEVEILTFSFENNDFDNIEKIENLKRLDAILISTQSQYEILKKYIDKDFNIVIAKLTLSKKGYDTLKSLGNMDTVMMVNLSLEMSLETITLLYQLGFDYLKFFPVYPNMEKVPDAEVAITTGELRFVPEKAKKTYDLGHRLIDKNTVIELLVALGLEEYLTKKSTRDYFGTLVSTNVGVEYLLSKSNILKNQFDTLLSLMDKGVICVDKDNTVTSCNGSAEKIVKINQTDMIGKNAQYILPEIDFSNTKVLNRLIKIKKKYITLSIYGIEGKNGEFNGAYAIIEDFQSKENTQNKLRLQLMNKGHIAKYNIQHIIGESKEITEVKDLIRRMAKSSSSVLITGESGTGKELVAQAIHNLSQNKDKHFVAINCAAFNTSLLESELFGYEAGAFTGASKEGSKGIFEMANNGTLFLDEIGEMPLELQVKLLRVIQEREIMRVGGQEVIKVNLRIIAATNLNLAHEILKGTFRKDLYYRLNVLPINVPPLRKRKEDIPLLFDYFMIRNNCKYVISREAIELLKNYRWDGNIRELINGVEYLDNLGKSTISIEDLPYHIKNNVNEQDARIDKKREMPFKFDNERYAVVLEILYESFKKRLKVGRKLISERAYEKNHHLSEYDVKKIMQELSKLELVNINLGRGGTTISDKGIKLMEVNQQ
ncbi:sigma 54-interacting transcriptional regulator [Alkalicella caledoniensis]|uniref:Sigma 54-interacting transcriptional regulator n=1 Tax=Alkalicella caledoniensis TaxID=2731377 RepID=A0A7G9W6L9_ALKCA|nr:sigma 54-interacting transcriptional regulator [Alkalicella caledoniensis]QNO14331.1 sigma 54-interacting transcriptional regulator [Alkalicella caledoniensis]